MPQRPKQRTVLLQQMSSKENLSNYLVTKKAFASKTFSLSTVFPCKQINKIKKADIKDTPLTSLQDGRQS